MFGGAEGGEQERGEDRDNRYDDKEFDQGPVSYLLPAAVSWTRQYIR
jgi:hypothetical protein